MKKRVVSMLLCVAMTAAMVAGCGSSSGDSSSDSGEDSGSRRRSDYRRLMHRLVLSLTGEQPTPNLSRSTFTEENGYKLIFDDAQQKQENQITGNPLLSSSRVLTTS